MYVGQRHRWGLWGTYKRNAHERKGVQNIKFLKMRGRVEWCVTEYEMKGGGQQWNPVDEVTHMPGVIRRLWLPCLCELWLRAPCSLSHILPAIYSTMHIIIGVWAQPVIGRRDVWKPEYLQYEPPQLPAPHFLLSCRLGEKNFNTASVKNQRC